MSDQFPSPWTESTDDHQRQTLRRGNYRGRTGRAENFHVAAHQRANCGGPGGDDNQVDVEAESLEDAGVLGNPEWNAATGHRRVGNVKGFELLRRTKSLAAWRRADQHRP